jgi:hypothetical protein
MDIVNVKVIAGASGKLVPQVSKAEIFKETAKMYFLNSSYTVNKTHRTQINKNELNTVLEEDNWVGLISRQIWLLNPSEEEIQNTIEILKDAIFERIKSRLNHINKWIESEECVVIKKSEYDNLVERDDKLTRLEYYGVDNWRGYSDAMSDTEGYFEEHEPEGDGE